MLAAAGELRRVMPGRVIDGRARRSFATDFGRQLRRAPALVVAVQSETDIVTVLEIATRYRIPCRVRGAGHSCGGQTLVAGGLVLLNVARKGRPAVVRDDQSLETTSRNRWAWVERSARKHNRAIPVLGDWPSLTVGGTLSVGGYGVGSLRWGSQIDHVLCMKLVLPTGRTVWCSERQQPELFRHTLAGVGALGVIEDVVFRTIPRAPWLSLRTYKAGGLTGVADVVQRMNEWRGPWPDVFYYTGKRDRILAGTVAESIAAARKMPAAPLFNGFAQTSRVVLPNLPAIAQLGVAAWLARFPRHARLWSDFVLPAAVVPEFLQHVQELLRYSPFARNVRTVYALGIRTPQKALSLPLAPVGDPPAALAFGIGLYCMVLQRNHVELEVVRAALRSCLEHCIELGGRPYMYGWHQLDACLLERAFGAALRDMRALRREHDPHGLFNCAFEAA